MWLYTAVFGADIPHARSAVQASLTPARARDGFPAQGAPLAMAARCAPSAGGKHPGRQEASAFGVPPALGGRQTRPAASPWRRGGVTWGARGGAEGRGEKKQDARERARGITPMPLSPTAWTASPTGGARRA